MAEDDQTFLAWAGDSSFLQKWQDTRTARGIADPSLSTLVRWTAFRAALRPLRSTALDVACAQLLAGTVSADDAPKAFRRGLAVASLQERQQAGGLAGFRGEAHQRTIARFTHSSDKVRTMLPEVLAAQALAKRSFSGASSHGRVGELRRELAKSRGGLSVRELMTRHADLVLQLTPCVLVSPDSLARFFPAQTGLFDVVVFDEASQIKVADAVGALGRSRSVVVVGDSRQMPPTSFAESAFVLDEDASDTEDLVEDEESILSECVQARVPRQWLSWHYRSQDEMLISFSNQQYYDNRLSSFPSPLSGMRGGHPHGYGINLVRVDGAFQRTTGVGHRTNRVEAEAIVSDIKARFAAVGEGLVPSVGVITFNIQHRNLIESLIRETDDERIIGALNSTNGQGLFVKNLENVQGDERDVILFSTAFGVDERGVLPLNFGPLNAPGGERRLNVAVTRARRQVVIYSSFDPEQLRVEQTSSVGIKHLRQYLELARDGADSLAPLGRRRPVIDRHRDDIAESLRGRGLHVVTDVGMSDFRVDLQVNTPEGDPLMAVLLDGPGWATRRTVADRDGIPLVVLDQMMHWPAVERVWLPEWLEDRERVVERLVNRAAGCQPYRPVPQVSVVVDEEDGNDVSDLAAGTVLTVVSDRAYPPSSEGDEPLRGLRRALPSDDSVEPHGMNPVGEAPDPTMGKMHDAVLGRERPRVQAAPAPVGDPHAMAFTPWVAREAGSREVLDALPARGARVMVSTVIDEVIEAEGPVHKDRLVKLVATAFGLNSVRTSRRAPILAATSRKPDRQGFFWPEGLDATSYEIHRPSATQDRDLAHVSPVELVNAMCHVAREAGGIARDELYTATIHRFGYTRRTSNVVALLDAALNWGKNSGRLVDNGGYITVPEGIGATWSD